MVDAMSTNEFSCKFKLSDQGKTLCLRVARDMVRLFGISRTEAIGRINKEWANSQAFLNSNLVFHEDSEELAKGIYYEDGTWWWVKEWMTENTPKAKPYP